MEPLEGPDGALLLLGGTGTRLQSLTRAVNKHLLPVYRYSLAEHALRWLLDCGFNAVTAVVPTTSRLMFEHLLNSVLPQGAELRIVEQPSPRGTADAVARGLSGWEVKQVAVLFGDNVFSAALSRAELQRLKPPKVARCYVRFVEEDLGHFTALEEAGGVIRVTTRPHSLSRGFAMTGFLIISADAFRAFFRALDADASHEDDIVDFVRECSEHDALSLQVVDVEWRDAGYSVEALWQAGDLIRRCVRDRTAGSTAFDGR